jgi:hypothetical protein
MFCKNKDGFKKNYTYFSSSNMRPCFHSNWHVYCGSWFKTLQWNCCRRRSCYTCPKDIRSFNQATCTATTSFSEVSELFVILQANLFSNYGAKFPSLFKRWNFVTVNLQFISRHSVTAIDKSECRSLIYFSTQCYWRVPRSKVFTTILTKAYDRSNVIFPFIFQLGNSWSWMVSFTTTSF